MEDPLIDDAESQLRSSGGVPAPHINPDQMNEILKGNKVLVPHITSFEDLLRNSPENPEHIDTEVVVPDEENLEISIKPKFSDAGKKGFIPDPHILEGIKNIILKIGVDKYREAYSGNLQYSAAQYYQAFLIEYIIPNLSPEDHRYYAIKILERGGIKIPYMKREIADLLIETGAYLDREFAEGFLRGKTLEDVEPEYIQNLFKGFINEYLSKPLIRSRITEKFDSFLRVVMEVSGNWDVFIGAYAEFSLHLTAEEKELVAELIKSAIVNSRTFKNKYFGSEMVKLISKLTTSDIEMLTLVFGDDLSSYIGDDLEKYTDEELDWHLLMLEKRIHVLGKSKKEIDLPKIKKAMNTYFFSLKVKYLRTGDPASAQKLLTLYKQDPGFERYLPVELTKGARGKNFEV